jgi:serine/threonine protein kinase
MPERDDARTQTYVPLTNGIMVSHYRIIEKLGAGGMGEVYLAEDTELDRKAALKFLSANLCTDEDCRKRFKREAQAAAKLCHPNIIHVYEVSEYQSRPFFAMEHVEGQTLREYSSGKELSVEEILELGIQICEGLNAAHEKGVTHRDIKPSNILIDSHGRVRIVDFGLASDYVKTSNEDKAISILAELLSMPSTITPQNRELNPEYAPLRDYPRFKALIEKYEKEQNI